MLLPLLWCFCRCRPCSPAGIKGALKAARGANAGEDVPQVGPH